MPFAALASPGPLVTSTAPGRPVTSAQALNNATLRHGLALADRGLKALADDPHLMDGLNVHRGRITNRAVAEALGYEAAEPEAVLAA